jgi:Protein of unknown function (DUF3307)
VTLSPGTRLALAHLLGDYVLQTHHQAVTKTKRWGPALAHAATYTAAHGALVTRRPLALLVIGGTHAVIDRYRLARWVCWLKNQAAPVTYRPPLPTATGYPVGTPDWLAVWLMVITDNTLHLLVNALVTSGPRQRNVTG